MRLTDLEIKNLKAPATGQKLYRDDTLAGFGCRVSQGGTKTFVLVHGYDRQFLTLGRYPIISLSEARTEAKRFLAERTLGKVRPRSITFPQARTLFLEEKSRKKKSTHKSYKYHLEKHYPFKGQLSETQHDAIERRLTKLPDSEYNHALAVGHTFFRWCIKRRYITENLVFGLSRHSRPSRSRVLSDSELKFVWLASNDETLPAPFRTIVKLLILTGQRRGEVSALRADYISEGRTKPTNQFPLITWPETLTKNGKAHTFPVGSLTKQILPPYSNNSSGLLFPARGKPNTPFNGWSKSKALLDELSGVADWTLHDLRRTFATRLAELGTPIHVVEKLLNHISGTTGGLVGIYQQYQYWDEQVTAISAWERRLSASELYRFRVGDYRVIFEVLHGTIWILAIKRRDEAYR